MVKFMDSAEAACPVIIAGCGSVTALGRGRHTLEQGMAGNETGLRAAPQFDGCGYMTNVIGGVPDDVWAALRDENPGYADARAFLLAQDALTQATAEAAARLRPVAPARIGLVLSTTKADIMALERLERGEPCSDVAKRHIVPSHLADDLADNFGAAGPIQCVSVACISGLLAIQQGARLMARGAADAVLVVGVDLTSHFVLSGFSQLKSLDPNGCRPFDESRLGLSLGEGAGAVVLTRDEGGTDETDCFLRGWGCSNDANHLTGPSRDGGGLALAIQRCLARAGFEPDTIDYVNAHGTGTAYNDAMESLALKRVFGEHPPPFSSCKGMLGHSLGAAGVVETVLCVLAGRLGLLPGTPGLKTRDPAVPDSVLTHPVKPERLRRILKINAGFGGVNGALAIERGGA